MGQLLTRFRLSGPPLALQIVGLLVGTLIVAQAVTLFLTMLLPPQPPPQYSLTSVAQILRGAPSNGRRGLLRSVYKAPPAPSGNGWLTSERSRHDLAALLGRDDADVRLYFYVPLPFAGIARPLATKADMAWAGVRQMQLQRSVPVGFMYADYQVAAATGGGYPGGGFPGGFPGGGFPGAGVPGGGFPGGAAGPIPPPIHMGPFPQPSPIDPASRPQSGTLPSMPQSGPLRAPGNGPAADPRSSLSPANPPNLPSPSPFAAGPGTNALRPIGQPLGLRSPLLAPVIEMVPPPMPVLSQIPLNTDRPFSSEGNFRKQALPQRDPSPAVTSPSVAPPRMEPAPIAPVVESPRSANSSATAPDTGVPVIAPPPSRGLFGLAPAPFVEGDFIAGMRLLNGEWAVVEPQPEPFPNSWQRRLLIWFLISFGLVTPIGLLFARQLVRPIAGFAYAAEQLGRDPTAPVLALGGPAEVGRAASAFNRMQSRLRSFVDDRTAMVGAISHDLRTPLTRLRFRLEDVPDDQREGMLAEVDEMEQMISSVLSFIRDASEPGAREKIDLRSILEDVVEDATFVGKPVVLEEGEQVPVEVDPLGIRRLLGNLVENAVKYGDSAKVRLFRDDQDAVAEVIDNGPGLPDDELERVFQPFYRAPQARASNKHGTGLGLAVCRSIARAHGGDVNLMRGDHGLVARLRLPLAFGNSVS
jgi:signal transduction histidine kinase